MVTKKQEITETTTTPDLTPLPIPEIGNAFPVPSVDALFPKVYNPIVSYQSIKEALSAPFPAELVSYRKGPYNKETKEYEQLRYVNVRHYEDRLNAVAFGHWSKSEPKVIPVTQWTTDYQTKEKYLEHGVIVTVTVTIHGVTHGGQSDFETMATAAESAAFKRACLPHGLGRELYDKETATEAPAQNTPYTPTPYGTAPATKSSDGGYPRPTEGQRGFLVKLGVPQSLVDQQINGNYVITGNVGRTLIDDLKDGGLTVQQALAKHGITLPAVTTPTDGLPVRTGYRR